MLRSLFFSPDGGEGDAPAPVGAADTADGQLLERLVERLDRRDAQRLATLRADLNASIDERLGQTRAALAAERVTAALHAAADGAGAHDLDTVDRLVDRTGIGLGEAGAVTGVAEALARLKQAKPFLFGAPRPTGGTAKVPPPAAVKAKSARDLSPAEWQAEKKRLGVRS
jgi:hypothetical protein